MQRILLIPLLLFACKSSSGDKGPEKEPESTTPADPLLGVLHNHNDLARTGANLLETKLTTANVRSSTFGKLYCRAVDDEIYTQILYAADLEMAGGTKHNVVFMATNNNSVYAFDADNATLPPLWEVHYSTKDATPVPTADLARSTCGGYKDINAHVGIMSTPAIDVPARTMYLVARTKEKGKYYQRLHAISLLTGRDRPASPIVIDVTADGKGLGSVNGKLHFDSMRQNQRMGLLLHQGTVYIGWAAHCDEGPYHGWFLGYDARTLQQTMVYNTTPNGRDGGIWQSGQAPAVDDDGNIYMITANGTPDLDGGPNRGESYLKLKRAGGTMTVVDWFTPFNWEDLERGDRDLGSTGPMLIPGHNLLVGASKEGKLYMLDRSNFGHHNVKDDSQVVQVVEVTENLAHIHGSVVYWKSPTDEFLYVMGEEDHLKQYKLVNGKLELFKKSAVKTPRVSNPAGGHSTMPGGILSISANGNQVGSAIVWVNVPWTEDANQASVEGALRAFDASDVSSEIWNNHELSDRDTYGTFSKFTPPTVYNGKVFVGTFSKQFCAFGLLN